MSSSTETAPMHEMNPSQSACSTQAFALVVSSALAGSLLPASQRSTALSVSLSDICLQETILSTDFWQGEPPQAARGNSARRMRVRMGLRLGRPGPYVARVAPVN